MKTFLIILGGAICAAAIYLLYVGILLVEANVDTSTFSLRVWEARFWLKYPPQLGHGLADNGRALLEILGGVATGLVGWRILSAGNRMAE